jgi:hypothetical protein
MSMSAARTGVASAARGIVFAGAAFALAVLVTGPLELLSMLDLKRGYFRDFHIYLDQSRAYLSGSGPVEHFVYPPLLALLLMPIARLAPVFVDAAWWLVQLGVLAGYARVLAGVLREHGRLRWPLALGLLITSLPILHGLKWGQVSSALVLLGALWLIAPGRGSAFGLGVAAACKVFPIAFALPALLWPRRMLVLHVAVWTLALGVVLPIVVLGVAPALQTLHHVLASAHEVTAAGPVPASQDLANALHQWFGPAGRLGVYVRSSPWLFPLPRFVQRGLYWLAALLLAAVTWHVARATRDGSAAVAAITMLSVPLLLPLAWEHYYCALPLAIAAVLGRSQVTPRALGLALAAWAIPALGAWAQLFDDWNFFTYESAHATTIAALLGIAAVWVAERDARPIADYSAKPT